MILPTKGILPRQALISIGGEILRRLDESKTVSRLWHDVQDGRTELTFEWFVLALDLLFILGVVDCERGRIRRVSIPRSTETAT